nr:hypothetical protein [Tanacetum cinerariifolium]
VDGKLAGLLTASKDLDNLIESQRSDKSKEGLGYNDVPPPIAQLYLSPKKDLSWTGLQECADDTVTDYSRPSPIIESTSGDDQNINSSATKNGESTDSILSKPAVKAPRNQDKGRRDNYRHRSKAKEQALKALMAIDGVGWDWSYMENEEEDHELVAEAPTEFALMANTSLKT